MIGKLCIQKVGEREVEGWFISPKRKEAVTIKSAMIKMPLSPGLVLDVDYSWHHLSVLGVATEKFHTVTTKVHVVVEVSRPAMGDTPEESLASLREEIRQNPPHLASLLNGEEKVEVLED